MSEIVSKINVKKSAEVHQLLPKIPDKKGTLLISLTVDPLRVKLIEYLNDKNLEHEILASSIKIEVDLLETFVLDIIDNYTLFNEIEMEAINILFLEDGEALDFNTFGRTQSLSKIYRLIKGKDLIYILNNKTLKTYFQPIIDIRKNEIYAYECLSRGMREDGTIMGSHLIFKTASKNDLLYYLDREARECALTNALANKINKKIFINFVPTAIYNPETCLRDTLEWAERLGHDPSSIVFEIIETEDIIDTKHLKDFLDTYRKLGFGIALDDIGSGYSSLSLLADIKPDYIKVDMEIIRGIDTNLFKQTIFKALAYIARQNNIKLLAEGVETKEELDYCVSEGVDFVQGFYFSKPTVIPLEYIE
jgi:EAL domain-containing protein (putative c-di-GMP-specific phosphodiesterase class I)